MKNKIRITVSVIFAAGILTVFGGCNAVLDTPPVIPQEKLPANGGASVPKNRNAGRNVVGAYTTAAGQPAPADQGPLPKTLTLKVGERYPSKEGENLRSLGVTQYGDNSKNSIFSLDKDKIVANKDGTCKWDYGVGVNWFSITVTVVKADAPPPQETKPQEKPVQPAPSPGAANAPQGAGKAVYAKPYTVKTTQWVYGITAPRPDEIAVQDKTYRSWPESQTTTWFNALKLAYSRGAGGFNGSSDASLCYGLTAANMLHWWIEQNKASLLEKKFNLDELAYRKSNEGTTSDIAEIVRTGKLNNGGAGGDTRTVLWWFLNEKFKLSKEDSDKLVKDNSVTGKEEFERYLNEALNNNEAVAITYFIEGRNSGRHVVNVWGISKDAQGNIVELWIGDSNRADPDDSMRGSKLYPWGIHYHGGKGNPYLVNTGNRGISGNKIETVIRLNLGQN